MIRKYYLNIQYLKHHGYHQRGYYMRIYTMDVQHYGESFMVVLPYKRVVPKAVTRNAVKRRFRVMFRTYHLMFQQKQLLVLPNANSALATFHNIQHEFCMLINAFGVSIKGSNHIQIKR